MKTVRVWFNHWFSTAYHMIRLLKEDERIHFVVVGSNTDSNCAYRAVCDEWETEPSLGNSDEYVDFCLRFCADHKIDVLVPRRNMLAIAGRLSEFDAIGVKVLVERDYATMSALCDKAKTYQMFTDTGFGYVPPYDVVSTVPDYEAAYRRLKTEENRVCLKFAVDEGARSFRVVDDRMEHNLTSGTGSKITYGYSLNALRKLGDFPPLLVMPYLSGTEISVDCLAMGSGAPVIIPRYKSLGRSETVRFEKDIVAVCGLFLDRFKLGCPCNLQFKYENDVPYLLEVNTRMSGGIPLSCAATGVNIPNIAVNRLLGVEKKASYDQKTKVVSFIETPLVLE